MSQANRHTPTVLVILDGWGHRDDPAPDNAIAQARTPNWDHMWGDLPHCLVSGSGEDVGLPAGQMGNSEVGHMNLGAGRVVHQDFTRITLAIADGSFFENATLKRAMQTDQAVHLLGLVSPGGVHSHEDHLIAAIDMARANGVKTVWVHAFLDGRDVPPQSAEPSLKRVAAHLAAGGDGGIASITGRYYAMDRDNRWERVEPAWRLVASGDGEFQAADAVAGLHAAYERGETDEFVKPTAIGAAPQINDGDSVVFMNFRADRARELTRTFVQDDFPHFNRGRRPKLHAFVCLTEYAEDIDAPVAFTPLEITRSIGEYVAELGMRQLRLAETEKYAHVTFFFSGGREQEFAGEDRILVPSPKVATYDLAPEMSALGVTDELVGAIRAGEHGLIVCNYANGDMVGHTGKLDASIKAVECIDQCLGRIIEALRETGGQCLVTADHGNVERLADHDTGQPHTAHTSEPVPLVYIGPKDITFSKDAAILSDIAPTLLALMDLPAPAEMTGRSLIAEPPQLAAAQ